MKAPSLSLPIAVHVEIIRNETGKGRGKKQKGKEKRWMMTITRHRYTHLSCLLFDSQRGALYGKSQLAIKRTQRKQRYKRRGYWTGFLWNQSAVASPAVVLLTSTLPEIKYSSPKRWPGNDRKVHQKWGGEKKNKKKKKETKKKKNTHRKWGPREYRHGSHFHSHRWAKKKKGRDKKKQKTNDEP